MEEFLAYIIKEDGNFYLVDKNMENKSEALKLVDDGKTIALTENESNRKYYNVQTAEAAIAEEGKCGLTVKMTRKLGPVGTKLPNEKLIKYLSEEDQETYKAIVERARAAKAADVAVKPDAVEKNKAKLEKLVAELKASGVDVSSLLG